MRPMQISPSVLEAMKPMAPGIHIQYLGPSGPQPMDHPGSRQPPPDMLASMMEKHEECVRYNFKCVWQYWMPPFPFDKYGVPGPNHIAVLLGFKPPSSEEEQMYVPESEHDREMMFKAVIERKMEPLSDRERLMIVSQVAALYSPQLAEAFLNPPGFDTPNHRELFKNAYTYMIRHICATPSPYFANFLLSAKSSKLRDDMALRLVEHIVAEADIQETRYEEDEIKSTDDLWDALGKAGVVAAADLLVSVLIARRDDDPLIPIPPATVTALLGHLEGWAERWPDKVPLKRCHEFVIWFLEQEGEWDEEFSNLRKSMRACRTGVEKCAKKDCDVEAGRRICGRCKTVAYCCRMHQKEHWNDPDEPHKDVCFKTTF